MAKSWKMTYRDWPNPGLRHAGISKEEYDETSSLKPSSDDERSGLSEVGIDVNFYDHPGTEKRL
jgi:hypothetical protein